MPPFNPTAPTPERSIGVMSRNGGVQLSLETHARSYPLRLIRWEFGSMETGPDFEEIGTSLNNIQ
jgi:hypothetical protein